jgi:hypothetical protein
MNAWMRFRRSWIMGTLVITVLLILAGLLIWGLISLILWATPYQPF